MIAYFSCDIFSFRKLVLNIQEMLNEYNFHRAEIDVPPPDNDVDNENTENNDYTADDELVIINNY